MHKMTTALLTMGLLVVAIQGYAGWFTQEEKHDTQNRMLNEMKATPRAVPPAADPRDTRIAALEKQVADVQTELREARGRASDLEQQLAERDRELASLRGSEDSSRMAGQLAAVQSELDASKARSADLEQQLSVSQSDAAALRAGAVDQGRLAAELSASQSQLASLQACAGERDKLAAELAALTSASGDRAELEKRLAARDRELAALRGDLSAEMAKLKEAERGVIRALRPQIEKGNIMVDLNNERLLINLASGYLFGSGEDQLKSSGADALKQVGAILKDFPEYKVSVDGHTDNRPIRSELKKKFPSNKELSEARASNAALALGEGGLSAVTTHGYADTQPVMPNTTDAGRAKNRRVEIRVTK